MQLVQKSISKNGGDNLPINTNFMISFHKHIKKISNKNSNHLSPYYTVYPIVRSLQIHTTARKRVQLTGYKTIQINFPGKSGIVLT